MRGVRLEPRSEFDSNYINSEIYNSLQGIAFKYIQKAESEGVSEELVYKKFCEACQYSLDKLFS